MLSSPGDVAFFIISLFWLVYTDYFWLMPSKLKNKKTGSGLPSRFWIQAYLLKHKTRRATEAG